MLLASRSSSNRILPLVADKDDVRELRRCNSDSSNYTQGRNKVRTPINRRRRAFRSPILQQFDEPSVRFRDNSYTTKRALHVPHTAGHGGLRLLRRYENGPLSPSNAQLARKLSQGSPVSPKKRNLFFDQHDDKEVIRTIPKKCEKLEAIAALDGQTVMVFKQVHSLDHESKLIVGRALPSKKDVFVNEEPALPEAEVFVGSSHAFRAIMRERQRRSSEPDIKLVKEPIKKASRECCGVTKEELKTRIKEAFGEVHVRTKLILIVSGRRLMGLFRRSSSTRRNQE